MGTRVYTSDRSLGRLNDPIYMAKENPICVYESL
jgi:hypothetical protein